MIIANDANSSASRDTIIGNDVKGITRLRSTNGSTFTLELADQVPQGAVSIPGTPLTFTRFEVGRSDYNGFKEGRTSAEPPSMQLKLISGDFFKLKSGDNLLLKEG